MSKYLALFLATCFVLPTFFDRSSTAIDKDISNVPLVIVSKDKPVDMLSAMPLVNKLKGDILFFDKKIGPFKDSDQRNSDYEKWKAQWEKIENAKDIILIGGEDSLNHGYFKEKKVTRISGDDRYDTSLEILKYHEKLKNTKKVHLVSGMSFADASIVASKDTPVVLISHADDRKNTKIKSELDKLSTYNTIVGGENTVATYLKNFFNADRISGKDRYETSRIFSGENSNGYIESPDISFVNNITDAHEAFIENKGFLLKKYNMNDGDIVFDIDYGSIFLREHPQLEGGKSLLNESSAKNTLHNNLTSLFEGVETGKYEIVPEMLRYKLTLPFEILFDKNKTICLPTPFGVEKGYLYMAIYQNGSRIGDLKIDSNDPLIKDLVNNINYIIKEEI
ncbi:cell wall-binding repeat-containing protein [Peptostreptococcus faecalis]|uniref:cell wall-binding repeat-containing protein n=1 Tax=Peptostreptococcus faecalis TaxID=2045015 RepID=UPI000C7BFEFF|nr:cell wall-binding repeat-containing protein [Peptostreptococcus faecalis]